MKSQLQYFVFRNEDIEKLTEFLAKYNNIFLLTGAGRKHRMFTDFKSFFKVF